MWKGEWSWEGCKWKERNQCSVSAMIHDPVDCEPTWEVLVEWSSFGIERQRKKVKVSPPQWYDGLLFELP